MINTTKEEIDYHFDQFTNYLIPFGSMDIRSAITTAIEAGFNGEWAAQQVEEFVESTGIFLDEIDPCYCVYEALLQIARNEIEDVTEHDFVNDQDEIYVHGNFMCTTFDYKQEAIDSLVEVLKLHKVKESDFNEATRWFLQELEITKDQYEDEQKS